MQVINGSKEVDSCTKLDEINRLIIDTSSVVGKKNSIQKKKKKKMIDEKIDAREEPIKNQSKTSRQD